MREILNFNRSYLALQVTRAARFLEGNAYMVPASVIALERRRQRMREIAERALLKEQTLTVPADVVGEWWRGRTDVRDGILDSVDVEPLCVALAKRAGEALAASTGATLVDAIVMASAASRGDIVYSSDVADLERLRRHFPSVQALRV